MAMAVASSLSVLLLLCLAAATSAFPQLSPQFYAKSCPRALATIKSAVTAAVRSEPRMGASLLRLHFHDCFVQASPSHLSCPFTYYSRTFILHILLLVLNLVGLLVLDRPVNPTVVKVKLVEWNGTLSAKKKRKEWNGTQHLYVGVPKHSQVDSSPCMHGHSN